MRRAALCLLAVLAVSVGASPARAEDDADALFTAGREAYARRDYRAAADLFARAHQQSGAPGLLFNIAQAWRLAGDCAQAARYYRQYLGAVPDAENRDDAEVKLSDMERCAEEAEAQAPGPGAAPIEPAPRVAATVATTASPQRDAPAIGLWIAGGGAVLLAASGFFWYRAHDADRELDRLFDQGGTFDDHYQDLSDRMRREQAIAVVLTAAGGVAIAGGLLYHFIARRRRQADDQTALSTVALVPGGAMVLIGCAL